MHHDVLLAAAGVLAGNQLARWFAVAVVGLNAINQMFFIPAYPFWSLTIIVIDDQLPQSGRHYMFMTFPNRPWPYH